MSGGEVWSYAGISRYYGDYKIDGFLLGDVVGTGVRTAVNTSGDIPGGEVWSSVGSSREYGDGKIEGFILEYVLGTGVITGGGSSGGSSYGSVDSQVEGYYRVTNIGDSGARVVI